MPSKPAGNSGSTQTVQSTTENKIPQWITNAAMQTWNQAQDVSNNLGPQPVTPLNQGQQSAIQGLWDSIYTGAPSLESAQAGTRSLTGYTPGSVQAGQLASTDLTPYLNPYTQDVINATMPLIDQQRMQALNQIGDQAVKTGSFGGSRQGVSEGVTNAQSALQAGQLGAQLNQQNFLQGQAAAQSDIDRKLAEQEFNTQSGLAGAQFRLGANQQLGNLGTAYQNSILTGLNAALAGQNQIQQNQQQQQTAQYQQPLNQLQVLQSTLGSLPYGSKSNQHSDRPGGSNQSVAYRTRRPIKCGRHRRAVVSAIWGRCGSRGRRCRCTSYGGSGHPWNL